MKDDRTSPFPDAHQDSVSVAGLPDTPQTRSPAYRLAFDDSDFLCQDALRPVRLQLELLKPQLALEEAGIDGTIVLFGGARIPAPEARDAARTPELGALSHYYAEAQEFARLMTLKSMAGGGKDNVICTGGGPGVMEAGNRGAEEAGGRSIGLSIVLPHEQAPNLHVTPELSFNFHYFAIRKMHFLMRAQALCIFPGGFGTMDETFEALTLIQTGRMAPVPFLLFGRAFWEEVIDWQALARYGTIAEEDLALFRFVETAAEAVEAIETWHPMERRGKIPGG